MLFFTIVPFLRPGTPAHLHGLDSPQNSTQLESSPNTQVSSSVEHTYSAFTTCMSPSYILGVNGNIKK